jgi:hypothetical protein
MLNGTYYLNNSGSKTKTFVNGKTKKVLLYHAAKGYCKMRTPLYCYSFGNFAGYAFKYEGKIISCLPENCDGVTVCFVDYKEKYTTA